MRIHHIGYAVKNHDRAEKAFAQLGYSIGPRTADTGRNVLISFATSEDGTLVELVSPLSADSPVDPILAKVGPSTYHICHAVDDISAAIELLRTIGWMPLGEPLAAPAIDYAKVVFAYHKVLGLMELVELSNIGDMEQA